MRWLQSLQNVAYRRFVGLVFPDLVRQMKFEGTDRLDLTDPGKALEEADFMRVEDNGAEVTLFAFTGPDVLYAGHSQYHFMGVVKRLERKFGGANFVFLRDPQRLGFMLCPDGSPGGLNLYASVIRSVMDRLGARHNVAIGSSFGGSVAHYMAYHCGMQQVITFGAMFNADSYLRLTNILKSVFDLKLLAREPRGYLEILTVTLSTSWCFKMVKDKVGLDRVADLVADYRKLPSPPVMTLFYGADARPDAEQASLMRGFPEVKLAPLPTGRHNTPGFLYSQGKLGSVIAEEICRALRKQESVGSRCEVLTES